MVGRGVQQSVGVDFWTKPIMVDLINVQTDLDRQGVKTDLSCSPLVIPNLRLHYGYDRKRERCGYT